MRLDLRVDLPLLSTSSQIEVGLGLGRTETQPKSTTRSSQQRCRWGGLESIGISGGISEEHCPARWFGREGRTAAWNRERQGGLSASQRGWAGRRLGIFVENLDVGGGWELGMEKEVSRVWLIGSGRAGYRWAASWNICENGPSKAWQLVWAFLPTVA